MKRLVILALSLSLFACSKKNGTPKSQSSTDSTTGHTSTVSTGSISGGPGVYVAGFEMFYNVGSDSLPSPAGAPRVAKIWKDGTAVNMTDGRYDAVANSVWADGKDVYAVGVELNADSVQVATLWKNGTSMQLGDGKNGSVANSVYVYGSDVYVAGNIVTNNVSSATVWKNGTASSLENGGVANSVFVYQNIVYVCGSDPTGAARLWKDGVGTALVNGGLGDANSVFVSSGTVYVAGTFENNGVLPGYWKDGKWTLLNYSSGAAKSIYVIGDSVFIAGYVITDAALWLNESISPLNDPGSSPSATTNFNFAITSVCGNGNAGGNQIHIAGYRTAHPSTDYTTTHDFSAPILFTNGTGVTLDNGDTDATRKLFNKSGGRATSVFVVTPS